MQILNTPSLRTPSDSKRVRRLGGRWAPPRVPMVTPTLKEAGARESCIVSRPKITLLACVKVFDRLGFIFLALLLDTSPYKMIGDYEWILPKGVVDARGLETMIPRL